MIQRGAPLGPIPEQRRLGDLQRQRPRRHPATGQQPVQVVAPPPSYVKRVAEICQEQGVLLIADEVMTGFGRTGRRFAMDHYGVVPDIIAAGKGISSGYAPLGAVIARRHVVDAIAKGTGTLLHGFTYNGHPVSVATGRAVLRRLTDGHLIEAADSDREGSIASTLRRELQSLWELDCVGDARGLGLMWAIEFVADRESKTPYSADRKFAARVNDCAMKRGVMLYPMQGCIDGKSGDHVMIAPPAVVTAKEISLGGEAGKRSYSGSCFSLIAKRSCFSLIRKRRERGYLRAPSICRCYCVIVLTASPTLKPEPETAVPTAETSSTSVSLITPTGDVMRRMTWPVDGSLISLVTRSTVS